MLDGNLIFTLNKAGDVLARRDVIEDDIALRYAKERDASADEHGNACDNEALNVSGLKKPLNGDRTIHVNMPDAARIKLYSSVKFGISRAGNSSGLISPAETNCSPFP